MYKSVLCDRDTETTAFLLMVSHTYHKHTLVEEHSEYVPQMDRRSCHLEKASGRGLVHTLWFEASISGPPMHTHTHTHTHIINWYHCSNHAYPAHTLPSSYIQSTSWLEVHWTMSTVSIASGRPPVAASTDWVGMNTNGWHIPITSYACVTRSWLHRIEWAVVSHAPLILQASTDIASQHKMETQS